VQVAALFDSHAHLDDPDWPPARLAADLAAAPGWLGTLSAGYGPERFAACRQVCDALPNVWRAVGLHPWWLAQRGPAERAQGWQCVVDELDRHGHRVVAIGELGLDKTRKDQMAASDQLHWMAVALDLARRTGRAVVLHVVGWHGHALDALRAAGGPWQGVVHRFSGSADAAEAYQALGLHLSLALEPRFDADRRARVVRAIAPERLLVESDWPFRDLDYPAALDAVRRMAEELAAARGESGAALLARSNVNFMTLFGLR